MLDVRNLSFDYNAGRLDAIPALRDVNVSVAPGELVAIIGHNGSGKSTLAKLLCAILSPTSGSITVDDVPSTSENVWEIRRRVGMVFQRPDDQLIASTVIDDIAFGPENLGLPRAEIEQRVAHALDALGLGALAGAQISELSGGEKQRVAIAGVLAMQPAYMILDEPTTMIAPRQARQLIDLAHTLRGQLGISVLHITHFMHEIVSFDRVVVMDGGRMLMQGTPREIFGRADELQEIGLAVPQITKLARRLRGHGVALPEVVLTPQELAEALAGRTTDDGRRTTDDGQRTGNGERTTRQAEQATETNDSIVYRPSSIVQVKDLHYTYLAGTPMAQVALRGVTCEVREGETLALLGGTQAGKSTLIEFFNALRVPPPGHVFFEDKDVGAPNADLDAIRQAVGIVFQQPETQLFEDTVGKDVSYAPRRKGLPPAESRALVEQSLTRVGLDYETYRLRYIYALSGGQKRRVAIAGVLAAQPRMLILDEPVAGLDPRGRAELATLIADLTQRLKLTVVLVGNAIDELAELADRAIVLHEGRVVMEGTLRELLRRADELHNLGLELSEPAEIALVLQSVYPDLPTDVLRIEELEAVLLQRIGATASKQPSP